MTKQQFMQDYFKQEEFVTVKATLLQDQLNANLQYERLLKQRDEEIVLSNPLSKEKYPKKLRRVAIWDNENKQTIEMISNNFSRAASTIAELYKQRWQIEIFFISS